MQVLVGDRDRCDFTTIVERGCNDALSEFVDVSYLDTEYSVIQIPGHVSDNEELIEDTVLKQETRAVWPDYNAASPTVQRVDVAEVLLLQPQDLPELGRWLQIQSKGTLHPCQYIWF